MRRAVRAAGATAAALALTVISQGCSSIGPSAARADSPPAPLVDAPVRVSAGGASPVASTPIISAPSASESPASRRAAGVSPATVPPIGVSPIGAPPTSAGLMDGWLPSEALAREVLLSSPALGIADAEIDVARASSQRLRVGPHEWVTRIAADRRRERGVGRFDEQELSLERGVRLPGKAEADRRLAASTLAVGELARADAWHEAARALLVDWAELVRERSMARILAGQAELAAQQRRIVDARMRAGEAARVDALAVEAEQARTDAAAVQGRNRAEMAVSAFRLRYPGLAALADQAGADSLPRPSTTTRDVQQWFDAIIGDNHEIELAEAQAARAREAANRAALERNADPVLGVRAAREFDGQERVLGAYVSLPLGGAARRADYARALAESDVAARRLEQTRRRVHAQARRTAIGGLDATANWRLLEEASERMARSAQLQARAWELGEAALPQLLQARRQAADAALAAELARVEALAGEARLLLDSHRMWPYPGE